MESQIPGCLSKETWEFWAVGRELGWKQGKRNTKEGWQDKVRLLSWCKKPKL